MHLPIFFSYLGLNRDIYHSHHEHWRRCTSSAWNYWQGICIQLITATATYEEWCAGAVVFAHQEPRPLCRVFVVWITISLLQEVWTVTVICISYSYFICHILVGFLNTVCVFLPECASDVFIQCCALSVLYSTYLISCTVVVHYLYSSL